jgi:hypothetical protein
MLTSLTFRLLLGLWLQWGYTPLRIAADGGYTEVVELLLAAGATVDSFSRVRQPLLTVTWGYCDCTGGSFEAASLCIGCSLP